MSVLDSAYFTTETLTTVGFGDFYFGNQSTWLRVWAIALMIIGATLVTVLYAMLTNLLVSRRIAQTLGRQLATRMTEHVDPRRARARWGCGCSSTWSRPASPSWSSTATRTTASSPGPARSSVPVVFGDSTVAASLDAVNLTPGAGRRRADQQRSRQHRDRPGRRRPARRAPRQASRSCCGCSTASSPTRSRPSFGFHWVRSTAALAAPWFVGAALGLDILTTFYVDRQPMLIGRLTVAEAGGLRGQTMSRAVGPHPRDRDPPASPGAGTRAAAGVPAAPRHPLRRRRPGLARRARTTSCCDVLRRDVVPARE